MKSPAMNAALRPIFDLETRGVELFKQDSKLSAASEILSKVVLKKQKQAIEQLLEEGKESEAHDLAMDLVGGDEVPAWRRYKINDASVEKLGELLNENPNGLLLVRDELSGWQSKLNKEEFQSDRAFYLESWEGRGQFTYDRIGRGTKHIENCTLSVIGGIQPAKLAPLVRGASNGMSDDGFLQRFQMAVIPDDLHSWEWRDRAPDYEAYQSYFSAFEKLDSLPYASDKPLALRFSESAQTLFIEWMTELQAEARSPDTLPVFESHLLKSPKTVAGLALLFELITSDSTPAAVGIKSTAMALEWADFLKAHAMRLYSLGLVHDADNARLIIKRRDKLSEQFTAREVTRKHWAGFSDPEAAHNAIAMLLDYGYAREIRVETGGRPSYEYAWNPGISEVCD